MLKISLFFSILLFLSPMELFSNEQTAWKACAQTKEDALSDLSSQILTNIDSKYSESISSNNDENIDEKINSMLNVSTNLSLANQKISHTGKKICIEVAKKDQVENTQLLLKSVLLLEIKNLPKDIDQKLNKLKIWIAKIDQVNNLILAFLKPSNELKDANNTIEKNLSTLNKKEKIFTDYYSDTIIKSDSLIWKSCEKNKQDAYNELNKKLFQSKTKKKDDEGIFKSLSFFSSLFTKDKEKMLDLFSKKVKYVKQEKQECAMIRKDSLLTIADSLFLDIKRFNIKSFDENPKQKYTQIKDFQEHTNVTKALVELFPQKFDKSDLKLITSVKKKLQNELKTTFPQSIEFQIAGAQKIKIKLNDKFVKKDTKYYLKQGTYHYVITAKGKCPLNGEVELEFLKDNTVSEDLDSVNLPQITFFTKESARIMFAGKMLKPNIENVIQKCDGDARYTVSYADQSKSDTLSLSPDMSKTVEIKFLTPKEFGIYNNAKTKLYKTKSGFTFSESLTPIASKNLEFTIDNDVEHGELTLNKGGSFTYKPNKDFIGLDSFTYVIDANGETSAPKVVNITISQSNIPTKIAKEIVSVKKILDTAENNLTKAAPLSVEKTEERAPKQKVKEEKVVPVQAKAEEKAPKQKIVEKKEAPVQAKAAEKPADDSRYMKFKAYADSLEKQGNINTLKKLQKKYPKMFNQLLDEKLSNH